MVLDQGRVVEFASPAELMSNTASVFYGMCSASGVSMPASSEA